jgi:hypothetical protein
MEHKRIEDSQLQARHSIDIDLIGLRIHADSEKQSHTKVYRRCQVNSKMGGSAGSEDGQFIKPEDIGVDLKTANVYTIDMGNSSVHVFGIAGH